MEWATLPFKKFADFNGRSRRKEYWSFVLLYVVCLVAAIIVEGVLGMSGAVGGVYGPLSALLILVFFVPALAVSVRRLHDTDRSGWWVLISIIPLIGGLVLLVFTVMEGTRGPNRFGADPKGFDAESAAAVF
ncbi:DUF805 domain-containing protein [Sphingosinicella sp. BN140058]|uniref:DUF805 domain-containing protein n=1 Tax=Sphingosinicella sp. BN140058 TaxID=1892855 RepID=UPI001012E83F|nr:DUF805 domain-containing protein [Sphingosinicella sp. BN140058]QAY75883.1 DUF805 domain-containing protein [Sphingosinicella sp. BN140058]